MKLNRKAPSVVFMEASVCRRGKKTVKILGYYLKILLNNFKLLPLRFELLNGHFGIIPEILTYGQQKKCYLSFHFYFNLIFTGGNKLYIYLYKVFSCIIYCDRKFFLGECRFHFIG